MAQNDYFQYGVECPVRNWRFEEFDRYIFFRLDATSGNTIYTADRTGTALNPAAADNVLSVGNTVVLGPSSYTGSDGYTEESTITAVDPTGFIQVTPNLRYDYAAGDRIVIRTAPRGWTPINNTDSGRIYARADAMKYGNSKVDVGVGYAARLRRLAAAGGDANWSITHTMDVNTILSANGVHRISAWGYGDGDTTQNSVLLTVTESDGTGLGVTAELDFSGRTSWNQQATTFTPGAGSSRATVRMRIKSGVSGETNFYLDNVTVEHAIGTDDTASGYYTATEHPDIGSVSYDKISSQTQTQLVNNTVSHHDPAGGRTRYWLTDTYTDVPQAFYDNMVMLEKQCLVNNRNLVFRPFIDDLPAVMVGRIRVTGFNKQYWDYGYRSFQFRFEEV